MPLFQMKAAQMSKKCQTYKSINSSVGGIRCTGSRSQTSRVKPETVWLPKCSSRRIWQSEFKILELVPTANVKIRMGGRASMQILKIRRIWSSKLNIMLLRRGRHLRYWRLTTKHMPLFIAVMYRLEPGHTRIRKYLSEKRLLFMTRNGLNITMSFQESWEPSLRTPTKPKKWAKLTKNSKQSYRVMAIAPTQTSKANNIIDKIKITRI